MADLCIQDLTRLSHLPDNPGNPAELIAGQKYYDVEFTGGSGSNLILTDCTINGTDTARNITVVTAPGNYSVQPSDYIIYVDKTVPEITTITLPTGTESRSIIIKDAAGNASSYPITINGNGALIDGLPTQPIALDFAGYELNFSTTTGEWEIIGSFTVMGPGTGNVVGPGVATDNAIARYNGITGEIIQNSGVTVDDSNNIAGINNATANSFIGSLSGNANTATALQTARSIGAVNFDGTANIVPQTIQTVDEAADTTCFVLMANNSGTQTGGQQPKTSTNLGFNASSGTLSAGSVLPVANDGGALGSGTVSWSDLFLASGGVINFANGDVTITHSTNVLTFSGASTRYAFQTGPVSPSSDDAVALGEATRGWSDLFLASGGVINWANGNATLTHSAGLLTSNVPLALGTNGITMTGSLAATGARVTKGWFTDIESTNAPTINGTAATGSGGLVRDTSPTITTPAFSGNPTGTITSSSYTPTLTNTTNVAASSAFTCWYTRTGDRVSVYGRVDIDPTSTGSTVLDMTLPIATGDTNVNTLFGVFNAHAVQQTGAIYMNAGQARFVMNASDTSNRDYRFTFMYRIA